MKRLVLGAVLLLSACGGGPGPTPQIVYVTPEPTPRVIYVTPAPTVAPASPSPSLARLVATDADRWLEFLNHGLGKTTQTTLEKDNSDMAAALKADNRTRAEVLANRIVTHARAELTWLNAHPPASCYHATWAAWKESVSQQRTSANYLASWLFGGPSSDIGAASSHLTLATKALARSVALRGAADAACAPS